MKGHTLLQGEIIAKIRGKHRKLKKLLLHENHLADINQTWHRSSFGERDIKFKKKCYTPFQRGDISNRVKKNIDY